MKTLDHLAALVLAEQQAKAEASRWADAAKTLEARIQAEMGADTEATIGGNVVYTWRHTGQFSTKQFTAQQPELAAKYTIERLVAEIDQKTLADEQPDLYTAFRARRFERKGGAVTPQQLAQLLTATAATPGGAQ